MKTKIAIFASGGGSNAEALITFFAHSTIAEIALIVSNKPDAYVLTRAKKHNIPSIVHTKADKTDGTLEKVLNEYAINFIVLAGYLQKIEASLINAFPTKIINIHPALLPKFGGKGMYGMNVHKAVVEAQEEFSGITIHYVNENYDEGNIITQYKCRLNLDDSPQDVQQKVLKLEHAYFAPTINELIVDLHQKK